MKFKKLLFMFMKTLLSQTKKKRSAVEAGVRRNMEILSSGSFINIENQEKIERLQATAVQLANAAIETEGFLNTEESAKRLALEFWQGLEYMCRESEEAAIKNIFLKHFLDRLRNARPTQTAAIDSPQDSAQNESVSVDNDTNPEDEFLGIIDTAEREETSIEETQAVTQESLAQSQDFLTLENDSVHEVGAKTTENVSTETVEESTSPAMKSKKLKDTSLLLSIRRRNRAAQFRRVFKSLWQRR